MDTVADVIPPSADQDSPEDELEERYESLFPHKDELEEWYWSLFPYGNDHQSQHGLNNSANTSPRIKRGLSGFVNQGTKVVSAMADTGSTENVISEAYANELKLEIQGSPCLFKLGNSKKTRSLGTLTLSYDINSRQDTS